MKGLILFALISVALQPASGTASENPLISSDVGELRAVYANRGGQQCIKYSAAIEGDARPSELDAKGCKAYQKLTPYTLEQILDPAAIAHFRASTLKATCEEQDKRVDGRFVKRTKACEQYFAQAGL